MAEDFEIDLTIVTGPHSVGKTRWCIGHQIASPNSMVIPYDEMIWAMRRNYEINPEVEMAVCDSIYSLMWTLACVDSKLKIVIDGFPNHLATYKRFLTSATTKRVVHLAGNHVNLGKVNAHKRKMRLPHVRPEDYVRNYYETMGFLKTKAFMDLMLETDTRYEPLFPQPTVPEIRTKRNDNLVDEPVF